MSHSPSLVMVTHTFQIHPNIEAKALNRLAAFVGFSDWPGEPRIRLLHYSTTEHQYLKTISIQAKGSRRTVCACV